VPRKQRNQPPSRAQELDFAAEITTSLIDQVKQLQAALSEKEEALKASDSDKARLEHEASGFSLRLKSLDESEQRYKDENWNLETQTHEMMAAAKEAASREQRLQQSLAAAIAEKASAQRELDDLHQNHGKLVEDHDASRKSHEIELVGLRRNVNLGDSERNALQRKVEELTSQNQELAKAVASRFRDGESEQTQDDISEPEDLPLDPSESEQEAPPSPSKGIHRHSLLETETLKSSLHHAHRMIQNLKSNVQREKTEKLDLKRMLQEARDELDVRSRASHEGKRVKPHKSQQDVLKKLVRPNMLGANRNSKTDVLVDDQDWEDRNGSPSHATGSRDRVLKTSDNPLPSTESEAYQTANETEDGFETAEERHPATDTDDFQTGAESLAQDSSDDLTETEGATKRRDTIRGRHPSQLAAAKPGDRSSFQSTASTSGDDGDYQTRTPSQTQPQRYRLKINRGNRRSRFSSEPLEGSAPSTVKNSPASFMGSEGQGGLSLFNELDNLNGDSAEEMDNTPSRSVRSPRSTRSLSESIRSHKSNSSMRRSVSSQRTAPSGRPTTVLYNGQTSEQPPVPKLPSVDSGMMTEPWKPSQSVVLRDISSPTASNRDILPSTPAAQPTTGVSASAPNIGATSRSASVSPRTVWDQPLHMFSSIIPTFGPASHKSTPLSTNSKASQEPTGRESAESPEAVGRFPGAYEPSEPESEVASPTPGERSEVSAVTQPPVLAAAPVLSLSSIQTLDTTPIIPHVPAPPATAHQQPDITTDIPTATLDLPPRFSAQLAREPEVTKVVSEQPSEPAEAIEPSTETTEPSYTTPQASGSALGNSWAHPNGLGGILGSVFGGRKSERLPSPHIAEDETSQTLQPLPLSINKEGKVPFEEVPANAVSRNLSPEHQSQAPLVDMADEASQTLLSSEQIDSMLKQKQQETQPEVRPPATTVMKPLSQIGAISPPIPTNRVETGDLTKGRVREPSGVREPTGMPTTPTSKDVPAFNKSLKRPLSAASIRQRPDQYPPLPPDHQKAIAAAAQRQPEPTSTGIMGPPLAPASSYRNRVRTPSRTRTPSEQRAADSRIRTPSEQRAPESPSSKGGTTPRARHSTARSRVSRRSSVSSFASEIDERFNIRLDGVPGMEAGTDPRMIQAITQTMIGEHMWKYTRKAGRGDMSSTRHRRFFWVHPYTRTLYWSERDPSTAGRAQLKAKSVAIEAVRVVTDENPMPPGLHRKSLVIMTPGRSVKVTATTGQRHETWFNALSYLLLRTGPDGTDAGATDGYITADDVAEFNPSYNNNNNNRSRISLTSWRSRRGSANDQGYTASQPPSRQQSQTGGQNASLSSRHSTQAPPARSKSRGGSFSSRISEYWRPSNNVTGSISSRHSRNSIQPPGIGSASDVAVHDSAEDLRRVIEHAEREGAVENVRACCDGMFKPPLILKFGVWGGRWLIYIWDSQADTTSAPSPRPDAITATAPQARRAVSAASEVGG